MQHSRSLYAVIFLLALSAASAALASEWIFPSDTTAVFNYLSGSGSQTGVLTGFTTTSTILSAEYSLRFCTTAAGSESPCPRQLGIEYYCRNATTSQETPFFSFLVECSYLQAQAEGQTCSPTTKQSYTSYRCGVGGNESVKYYITPYFSAGQSTSTILYHAMGIHYVPRDLKTNLTMQQFSYGEIVSTILLLLIFFVILYAFIWGSLWIARHRKHYD